VNKTLHIISFDIPFPANYGGVIDVFYRIKALHACGVQITLHCFIYGERTIQPELENYCIKVYYYPRKKWVFQPFLPYIVSSRADKNLLNNLLQDNAPILFEAVHSTYLMKHPALKKRQKLLRMHNIEHDYYALLAASESNILLKLYYALEAKLLKSYESNLQDAQYILAISPKDQKDLANNFGKKVVLIPAFHGNESIEIVLGKGNFCFYHGKLSVAENNLAALYLVREVFSNNTEKLIIAGNGASPELKKAIAKHNHIELKENLSPAEITLFIQQAHINILPTFQATGIKLKLINVLFNGRFVLVNSPMVLTTGLESAAVIANTPEEMNNQISRLNQMEFSAAQLKLRSEILQDKFDNKSSAQKIIELLY
jgi:hypothetical protein